MRRVPGLGPLECPLPVSGPTRAPVVDAGTADAGFVRRRWGARHRRGRRHAAATHQS
ncbi:MAG: hypothetical protein IPF99_40935 [Deltaproteobacteria bacterium]|nr:hypothetical protein [Deltaproteobacteria bacterium]